MFWKDTNGRYIGANDLTAETAQLKSHLDIIGMRDFDLRWKNEAVLYEQNDNIVIKNYITKPFFEKMFLSNFGQANLLTIKSLLYAGNNEVIGIFGISYSIAKIISCEDLQAIKNAGVEINKNGFPKITDNRLLSLTKRQSQCLYHLVRGLTAKQIAKVLGLSNRTVEFYLENLKEKFNCSNKSDLIAKAIEMGFGNIN